jgi:adenylosuccinate synthase
MTNGRLVLVVGGQFGSEAKGHVAGQLAARYDADLAIRTGGPNAGHTYYGPAARATKTGPNGSEVVGMERQQFKLRQLPTASVSNPRTTLAVAAGALLDPDLLSEEMWSTDRSRVLIDPAVTMLTPDHRLAEERDPDMQWGSTREGIGAARADRIHRTARTWGSLHPEVSTFRGPDSTGFEAVSADVAQVARNTLGWGGTVLIEAAQGYGLGLHTQYYPKTTSADCRAIDALADVGLSPWCDEIRYAQLEVWVVVRPYPIRVAGESGPLMGEVSWDELGLPEERTTVTNKVRRVGQWDHALVTEAVRANGGGRAMHVGDGAPVKIALTMVDQVIPELEGLNTLTDPRLQDPALVSRLWRWMQRADACGAPVGMLTTSPTDALFETDSPSFQRFAARQFASAGD